GIPIGASWPGRALNRRSTRPGCDWGWLGVLAGVRFRTGGGAPTRNTRSGVLAGRALSRRSTRPRRDGGWLGVLAGLRFRTGAVLLQETSARRAAVLVRVGGGMGGGPGRRGRRGGFSGAGGRRCIPRPGRRRYPARGRAR